MSSQRQTWLVPRSLSLRISGTMLYISWHEITHHTMAWHRMAHSDSLYLLNGSLLINSLFLFIVLHIWSPCHVTMHVTSIKVLLLFQNSDNLLHCVLHVKVDFLLKTVGKVQESSLVEILFKTRQNTEQLIKRYLTVCSCPLVWGI